MTTRCRSLPLFLAMAALAGAGLTPKAAHAQAPPDFLLRHPRVTVGIKAGFAHANAGSEIFDFAREQLTLDRRDFSAPSWGGQIAVRLSPRMDLAFDVAAASTSTRSEFRDWVDGDDLPIEQDTEFRRIPVTLGLKWYLQDRGREVGRFAWIPSRVAPYLGASAGWVWYRFLQTGDFIDFETLDVFPDTFTSEGNAPTVHLFGGADWSLGPAVFLTTEARYAHARADMSGDFVDFDAMDLSGFQATVGFSVRF